jgi:hypothetical protein
MKPLLKHSLKSQRLQTATNFSGGDKKPEPATLLIGKEKSKATNSTTLLHGDLKAMEDNTATDLLGGNKNSNKKAEASTSATCSVVC